jgi:predicted unusual protein kinase regulating ubiquinone biosynthesis (AarF/ABC1/UbiB family)
VPTARRSITAAVAVVAAGAGAAGAALADPTRKAQAQRWMRISRLSTRRAVTYASTKLRGRNADEERRRELDSQFAIRTAEDVTRELGQMKGAVMKVGQLMSFIVEGLPEAAKESLASLQADVPPMAPSLAAEVIATELGDLPEKIFLDWEPVPRAAASIGQVHKAVLRDGREVAVKVQYPGAGEAIRGDLANAKVLTRAFSMFAFKSLDVETMVAELQARMGEELDYELEASRQDRFHHRYRDHPFLAVPRVIDEFTTGRVLTSEWVDGMSWSEFEAYAGHDLRQRTGEALFRFQQGAIYRAHEFNADPHPGNYRFWPDGRITLLDFGLVKQWTEQERASLWPIIDPLLDRDVEATVHCLVAAGFLGADHGLDPQHVFEYVSTPYEPFLVEEFTFTREFTRAALSRIADLNGPYADVINSMTLPSSFVLLDRVVWGIAAILGRLEATNHWRGILAEYRVEAEPCTELGRLEAAWLADRRGW